MLIDFDAKNCRREDRECPQITIINLMNVAAGIPPHATIIKYLN